MNESGVTAPHAKNEKGSNEMKVISFVNLKGGVAKTTSVINAAAILARIHKQRVLVVDADSQCNLTVFSAWITTTISRSRTCCWSIRAESASRCSAFTKATSPAWA